MAGVNPVEFDENQRGLSMSECALRTRHAASRTCRSRVKGLNETSA